MKNMKKFALSLLLLGVLGLSSCGSTTPVDPNKEKDSNNRYVTDVTLDIEYFKLEIGESLKITPTVSFLNDEVKEVSTQWRTSKANVATVDDGLVFAVGSGTTYITYIAGFKSASCKIDVPSQGGDTPEPEPGPGPTPEPGEFTISINPTSKTLTLNEAFRLTATTSEAAEVTWATDNADVATVENGLVRAMSVGTANITASANGKSATCVITVADNPQPVDPDESLKIVTVYFFLDYNNVDMEDTTGTKLLAKFKWYQDVPLKEAPIPANPTKAADPAFPYFVGWSSHTISDTKLDLWDMDNDVIRTRSFIYIYGIWSDVEAFNV